MFLGDVRLPRHSRQPHVPIGKSFDPALMCRGRKRGSELRGRLPGGGAGGTGGAGGAGGAAGAAGAGGAGGAGGASYHALRARPNGTPPRRA